MVWKEKIIISSSSETSSSYLYLGIWASVPLWLHTPLRRMWFKFFVEGIFDAPFPPDIMRWKQPVSSMLEFSNIGKIYTNDLLWPVRRLSSEMIGMFTPRLCFECGASGLAPFNVERKAFIHCFSLSRPLRWLLRDDLKLKPRHALWGNISIYWATVT